MVRRRGRTSSGALVDAQLVRPGERGEVVERLRVRKRFAARRVRGINAHEDALDRHLEDLARERPRDRRDLPYLVRNVAGRAVFSDPPFDALEETVVELGALTQDDEE